MGFLPINVAGVSAAEDFSYPAGEYILQCKEAKVEPTKAGDAYRFIVKSQIVMGPGPSLDMQGKPITHSYALSEKSRPFVVRFAIAAGVPQQQIDSAGGQIDTDWFPGKQYVARISLRDNYTNVDRERPLAAWTHGSIAGQAASAPPQGMAPQGAAQPGLLQPMPGAMQPPAQQPPMQQPPMQQAAPPVQFQDPQVQFQQSQVGQPYQQPPMQQPPMMGQPQMAAPAAQAPAPQMQQSPAPQTQGQQPGVPMPQAPPPNGNTQAAGMPAPPPPGGQVPQQ